MIGGAVTFNYYVRLDKYKLNLAGQELKEKKSENYEKICSELDNRCLCIVNGEKKNPSLSNAVLNFYDIFTKRKNSDKIRVLENNGSKGSPDRLVDIIDGLWDGISHLTTAFLMQTHQELNKGVLNYNDVREELRDKSMKYVSRNIGVFIVKTPISAVATILGPFAVNRSIGLPIATVGALVLYDSIRQFIAYCKHDEKGNFVHEKEFRKLLHCARETDKYMTKDIDITPPRRPMALGGIGELEKEAIEIRKKLKKQR